MNTLPDNGTDLSASLEMLRQELARLSDRVALLEGANRTTGASKPPAPVAEGLSEELILVISAAVAAFLGKRAPIRQIRLVGSAPWSLQGRATIHASHGLWGTTNGRQP